MGYHRYKDCIEACLNCAAVCNHCASSCLRESDVTMMAECIRLDMECAAICYAAAQVMSLDGKQATRLATICGDICEACAAECRKHDNKHCQECADACQKAAEACRDMSNRS